MSSDSRRPAGSGRHFAKVPDALVTDSRVSDRAVRLYARLAKYAGGDGKARPSRARLAEDLGLSEATVKRGLTELLDTGWIGRTRRGRANVWDTVICTEPFGWRVISDPSNEGEDGAPARMAGQICTDDGSDMTRPRKETQEVDPVLSSVTAVAVPDEQGRSDVEALCRTLADLVEGNGSRRPTITKRWRDAARLLLDKDGREFDKALALLKWSQTDEFWRANILSMPKFREKYDQLRLKALEQWEKRKRTGNGHERKAETHATTEAVGRALAESGAANLLELLGAADDPRTRRRAR